MTQVRSERQTPTSVCQPRAIKCSPGRSKTVCIRGHTLEFWVMPGDMAWRLWPFRELRWKPVASSNCHFVRFGGAGASQRIHFERFGCTGAGCPGFFRPFWPCWIKPEQLFRAPNDSNASNANIFKTQNFESSAKHLQDLTPPPSLSRGILPPLWLWGGRPLGHRVGDGGVGVFHPPLGLTGVVGRFRHPVVVEYMVVGCLPPPVVGE